jgi:hypothetical protein
MIPSGGGIWFSWFFRPLSFRLQGSQAHSPEQRNDHKQHRKHQEFEGERRRLETGRRRKQYAVHNRTHHLKVCLNACHSLRD